MALDAAQAGETAQSSVTVAPQHFASGVFAEAPDVFSTPALGALVEATAAGWLQRHLGDGQMSVGTQIVINHTAATPEGMTVTVETKVVAVEGRRVDFEWSAWDEKEAVGSGTHQRFVVDSDRFLGRLAQKRS